MSSNNASPNDEPSGNNDSISKYNITIDQLRHPGISFKVGGCSFITAGGVHDGQLNVIRVETAERDQLDVDLLEDDIENGDLEIRHTHSAHSEVPINRVTLATLLQYIQYDMEELPERVSDDVIEAVEEGVAILD